tara:strand:+ start:131 stop:535 length:405 start_codon:yes stop_codon:yes gene_type:complete
MNIQAIEYGLMHDDRRFESDIVSISDSKDGLKIIIETLSEGGYERMMEVSFEDARGFRFLDEGDLHYYFSSGAFSKPYHVFKILSGGWVNGEISQPGMLGVSKAVEIGEWFVVTNNGCVNVLSSSEPNMAWISA